MNDCTITKKIVPKKARRVKRRESKEIESTEEERAEEKTTAATVAKLADASGGIKQMKDSQCMPST